MQQKIQRNSYGGNRQGYDGGRFLMNVFIFLLFWCCASLGNAWFIMKTMEYLIVVSKKRSLRLLMLTACFILVKSVIFMGDPVNILGMTAFFLFAVWMSCEGSFWKKTAVGLLYITVFFAFNAIRDNYIIYDIRMFSRPLLFINYDMQFFVCGFILHRDTEICAGRGL